MLDNYRKEIDKIDKEIVDLLVQRGKISKGVGVFKRNRGLDVYDFDREIELVKGVEGLGVEKGLSKEYINKVFQVILRESKKMQK